MAGLRGRKQWSVVALLVLALTVGIVGSIGTFHVNSALGQTESVVDKAKKDGVLKIGVPDFRPFSWKDVKTGKWQGICVDIMTILTDGMGIRPAFVETTWDTFILGLQKGDFDIFAGTTFYSVERAMQVAFPQPIYRKSLLGVINKKDASKYKTWQDFGKKGTRIIVDLGGYEETMSRLLFRNAQIIAPKIQSSSGPELMEFLKRGRGDVVVQALDVAYTYASKNDWSMIVDPQHPFAAASESFPIRYGDEKWKAFLDIFFTQLVDNGTVNAIAAKYLPPGLRPFAER